VGIDFGTTHSAVAWALTSSPDEYEVITTWPGQVGKDWGKVPSDISYTVSGSSGSGDGESPKSPPAAEGTAPGEIAYKWFVVLFSALVDHRVPVRPGDANVCF